jgi:hypothetical protein
VTYLNPDLRGLEDGDIATFTGNRVNTNLSASSPGDYIRVLTVSRAVPEPATWAMLILGFGAAGSAIRRRRALAIG